MTRNALLVVFGAATWATAASAAAAVAVAFIEPERYSDFSDSGGHELSLNLEEIEQHLKRLGEKYLAPGQSLKIDVLDIDLAGREERAGSPPRDIRVLRGAADWPRFTLRYTLDGGSVREETVLDRSYLARSVYTDTGARLPYEKQMLENWFRERFGARH
jgi:hypothetical protein